MTRERRYSNRHPVDFDLDIRCRGRRFPSAHARNISREGIHVETHQITLPRGTMVELEIRLWGREWLIPAIVVHGDRHGVGLMFREAQSELYERLIRALPESANRYRTPETSPNRAEL